MRTLTFAGVVVGLLMVHCSAINAWYSDGWYGSGDDDDEDHGSSGDHGNDIDFGPEDSSGDGQFPDSGRPPRTRCVELREAQYNFPNSYRPQCTASGDFEPTQCHPSTGECWCVDRDGHEVLGTIARLPHTPNCPPHGSGGGSRGWPTRRPVHGNNDDVIIIDSTTAPSGGGRRTRPPSDGSPDVGDADDQSETEVEPVPSSDWRDVILKEPLFLAGLIGGAVLLLLLIILILMFIVYRMRKKDEGSYSLDEPRQSFSYTRAKDQEFFA